MYEGYDFLPKKVKTELPDAAELESWRSMSDELLGSNTLNQYTLRKAAHLLQNAYLFAKALKKELGDD